MKNELRRYIEEIVTLADDEFNLISFHFTRQKFKKKEFLISQGKRVDFMYFVVSGLLKLTFNDESGKEHILSFATEDWWETDYLAFTHRTKATMSLQCLESSDILCIRLENFKDLMCHATQSRAFFSSKGNSGAATHFIFTMCECKRKI